MSTAVKELGLTVNELTVAGLATAPPSINGEWAMFEIQTSYYNQDTKAVVPIKVPVIVRNQRDLSVVTKWVTAGKQLLVRGNYLTWETEPGSIAGAIVPQLIKLGPNSPHEKAVLSLNSVLLIGKVSTDPVINEAKNFVIVNLAVEYVEKTDNGFSESLVVIPVSIPVRTEAQLQWIPKMYAQGRQLMVQGYYGFFKDNSGSIVPGIVSRLTVNGIGAKNE